MNCPAHAGSTAQCWPVSAHAAGAVWPRAGGRWRRAQANLILCAGLGMIPPLAADTVAQRALHDVSTPVLTPGESHGPKLPGRPLGIGPTMDVALEGDLLFAIGRGRLDVLTGARSGNVVRIGELGGLGNTRQIAVSRGHAFVTSREDGLFVVDVREPSRPRLVAHYDTAELATGIAVAGEIAAVANRFAGVEVLDISRPAFPRYLATVRVGEAQSVAFHGSWLYAGAWSEKAVAVIDVQEPARPRLVRTIPLQGNGDGLDVRGRVLVAATGHHARAQARPRPGDAAWGRGHGVEFFDVSDPATPRRMSGMSFPPFYRIGMDMWGAVLGGGYAYVNDTHNGFFLIDVRDPERPRPAGWHQLPAGRAGGDPSPAAGLAVAGGRAFVAGAFDDLHLVETGVPEAEPHPPLAELRAPATIAAPVVDGPRYDGGGSIRAVLPWRDDLLLVAAGAAGLHVVRAAEDGFARVAVYPTFGFARDVAMHGERVWVAESLGGLSCWERRSDGTLHRTGAYQVAGKSIHQVVLADEGRVAFLAVGGNTLHVVRLDQEGRVERLLETTPPSGLFYREPIAPVAADGCTVLVQWHSIGLTEYRAENGAVRATGQRYPHAMDTECGVAPWRDRWLGTSRRGLFPLAPGEMRSPHEIGLQVVGGRPWPGKPTVDRDVVFVADPFLGDVSAIDLSSPDGPMLISALRLGGHPGRVRPYRGKVLVPAGRDGLLLWDFRQSGL